MLILTRRVGETLMIGDEVRDSFRGKGQPGTYWRKCPEGSFCSP